MNYLLDTNVISEVGKPRPDRRVLSWLAHHEQSCLLSALVIGELAYGAERIRRSNPRRSEDLDRWREATVASFGDRIVAIDERIAIAWGRLAASLADAQVAVDDGLIAATALAHDWTLATRNVRHFERTGVRLVNPFGDES